MNTTHPLAALRERIMDSHNPAAILRTADDYLNTLTRMGDNFVLPAQHALVHPILEYYAGDLTGWVKYVKGIRDRIGNKDPRWTELYDLYRTLEVRRVQRDRRLRLNAAVDKALALGLINDDVLEKQRYANRCTQVWAKQRSDLMEAARKGTAKHRISEDERNELLTVFWDTIDQHIEEGKLPPP